MDGKKEIEGTEYYYGIGAVAADDEAPSQNAHQKASSIKHDGNSYYVGQFQDDLAHGKGTRFFDDKRIFYNGEFKNGKRNGWGSLFVDCGYQQWVYQGYWKHDQANGKGKLYIGQCGKLTGMTFEGIFENNVATDGELIKRNGMESIRGEMRIQHTRGFVEHDVSFFTLN